MNKENLVLWHSATARKELDIQALMKKYGIKGYASFFLILELMCKKGQRKLSFEQSSMLEIAELLKTNANEVDAFIRDCIGNFKLFECDEKTFWLSSKTASAKIEVEG